MFVISCWISSLYHFHQIILLHYLTRCFTWLIIISLIKCRNEDRFYLYILSWVIREAILLVCIYVITNYLITITTLIPIYYILSLHCTVMLSIYCVLSYYFNSCLIISIFHPVIMIMRWFYQAIFIASQLCLGIPFKSTDMKVISLKK